MHSTDVQVTVRHFTFRNSLAEGSPAGRTPSALLARELPGSYSHCLRSSSASGPGHGSGGHRAGPRSMPEPGKLCCGSPVNSNTALSTYCQCTFSAPQTNTQNSVANTQISSASPSDQLSGPYREEIAWDGQCLLPHPVVQTMTHAY